MAQHRGSLAGPVRREAKKALARWFGLVLDPPDPADGQRTIVVSYPRSGLNWVRYCCEYFSGVKTPGRPRLIAAGPELFARTHDVRRHKIRHKTQFYDAQGQPRFGAMILLLRDYKAVYVRQARRRYLPMRVNLLYMRRYLANLAAYDAFPGPKLLVYYEDLMRDFAEMERILAFLGIEADTGGFDVEEHARRSMGLYDIDHGAQTKANRRDTGYHSRRLTPEQRRFLDAHFQRQAPELYRRYLARYAEPDDAAGAA